MEIGTENCIALCSKMDKHKAETRNPGLSIETKTRRRVGRPKKSWEDDIYQFAKPDDTEETRGSDLKNNDTWLNAAKGQKRWKEIGKDFFSITHKAAHSTKKHHRRSTTDHGCAEFANTGGRRPR